MSGLAATPGGWLEAVLGDPEIRARLGEEAQIADMLRVEAAYTQALGAVGRLSPDTAARAAEVILSAKIDRAALSEAAAVDGMPVPGLVRQLTAALPEELREGVHTGLTSQDVMDSALMLGLRDVAQIFGDRLVALEAALDRLEKRAGGQPLMGRTRMQAALEVGTSHRIASWASPLRDHRAQLVAASDRLLRLQLGGPVGTGESLGSEAHAIAEHMAQSLGLTLAPRVWHTDRAALVAFGAWAAGLSGHLGKIGHDIALMAQQGIATVTLRGGGSSSAMGHKKNPVKAETLMSLARFSAVEVSALHLTLEHEQERSGTAWALEWLCMPRLMEATGAGLLRAVALIDEIESMGTPDA